MPETIGRPSASRSRRLARSSSLTLRPTQPLARSSPRVCARRVGSEVDAGTGGERTTASGRASNGGGRGGGAPSRQRRGVGGLDLGDRLVQGRRCTGAEELRGALRA